jgi:hypothetical protein
LLLTKRNGLQLSLKPAAVDHAQPLAAQAALGTGASCVLMYLASAWCAQSFYFNRCSESSHSCTASMTNFSQIKTTSTCLHHCVFALLESAASNENEMCTLAQSGRVGTSVLRRAQLLSGHDDSAVNPCCLACLTNAGRLPMTNEERSK